MNRVAIILLVSFSSYKLVCCQEVWSLEKCLARVKNHSLVLQDGKLDLQAAAVRRQAAALLRLPSLNGNTNLNLSFGRQIDPTTNDFNNQRFGSQNLSLSSAVTLYNGGRITKLIRQTRANEKSAQFVYEQSEIDQSLAVVRAYLQVLLTEEIVVNAEKSLALAEAQLEQIHKLVEAGTRAANERLDLVAQIAQAEQVLIEAINEVAISYLTLKQILQIDQGLEIEIAKVTTSLPTAYDIQALDAVAIFDETRSWQPRIQAGSMQIESTQLEVALMKSSLVPTIALFASAGSRFSSLAKRQGGQAGINTVEQDITLNGESAIFGFEEPFYNFNDIPYRDQIRENLDYGLGLNIAIPIYNQGQNRADLHLAELEVVRATNAAKAAENDLKSEILSAVTQVKAGKVQYEAAQRTVEAMNRAFIDAEKRYSLGVINSLDFVTAQNSRDQALGNLTATKYDYLFRTMVLDFYRGKKSGF